MKKTTRDKKMKKQKKAKTNNFSFYLKDDLLLSLKERAAADRRSTSQYLRLLIEKALKEEGY